MYSWDWKRRENLGHLIQISKIHHNIPVIDWLVSIIIRKEVGKYYMLFSTKNSDIRCTAPKEDLFPISFTIFTDAHLFRVSEIPNLHGMKTSVTDDQTAEQPRYLKRFHWWLSETVLQIIRTSRGTTKWSDLGHFGCKLDKPNWRNKKSLMIFIISKIFESMFSRMIPPLFINPYLFSVGIF